jgi:hypothetical protein
MMLAVVLAVRALAHPDLFPDRRRTSNVDLSAMGLALARECWRFRRYDTERKFWAFHLGYG